MTEGVANSVTKIVLLILTSMFTIIFAISLITYFFDDSPKPFSTANSVAVFITTLIGLVLSVLAFWGAFAENACLCYISLVWCIIAAIGFAYQLIVCLIKDNDQKCSTMDYILKSLCLTGSVVLAICIFAFIQSIK